jgi:hypothetical protein
MVSFSRIIVATVVYLASYMLRYYFIHSCSLQTWLIVFVRFPHNHQLDLTYWKHNQKDNSTSVFIQRNLQHCPQRTKGVCCTTLLRSLLEYASTVWDPFTYVNIRVVIHQWLWKAVTYAYTVWEEEMPVWWSSGLLDKESYYVTSYAAQRYWDHYLSTHLQFGTHLPTSTSSN